MNPHFFTAPFYFAFIWFRVQGSGFRVQGSGFKVQGSRGGFAAFFLEDAILVSQPSPRGEGFVSGIPLSSSNLRPFGAPPSIGRREHPREPLPLEGAAERSEAGLASFFAAKPPPLCLPLEEKAQRRGGWGTGGRKVREGMRIKQAIHGSTRAPVFVNDDARK